MVSKCLMVFKGGKNAPANYVVGVVYNLPCRHLNYPWFTPLPEGVEVKEGDYVGVRQEEPEENPPQRRLPRKRFSNLVKTRSTEYKEEGRLFKMRFQRVKDGHPIKGAPANYVHGEIYEMSLRHMSLPWWELVENIEPLPLEDDSIFVEPEALSTVEPIEEPDFEEYSQEPSQDEFEKLNKAALIAYLRGHGVRASRQMRKAELVELAKKTRENLNH